MGIKVKANLEASFAQDKVINRSGREVVVDYLTYYPTEPKIEVKQPRKSTSKKLGLTVITLDWYDEDKVVEAAKRIVEDRKQGFKMVMVSRMTLEALYDCWSDLSHNDNLIVEEALRIAVAPDIEPEAVLLNIHDEEVGVNRLVRFLP